MPEDKERRIESKTFGWRHQGETFSVGDGEDERNYYVGLCQARVQGSCTGLVIFKLGKPSYACGAQACRVAYASRGKGAWTTNRLCNTVEHACGCD